jgi:hypothetical protein
MYRYEVDSKFVTRMTNLVYTCILTDEAFTSSSRLEYGGVNGKSPQRGPVQSVSDSPSNPTTAKQWVATLCNAFSYRCGRAVSAISAVLEKK